MNHESSPSNESTTAHAQEPEPRHLYDRPYLWPREFLLAVMHDPSTHCLTVWECRGRLAISESHQGQRP
jgi:hypothetical protein